MLACNIEQLDWDKVDGLIPAVIQNNTTGMVLMLGYMNQAALLQSLETGCVTFYSRTKQRLWMKGETSGNKLIIKNIYQDCDQDSLIILVDPIGETCHLGHKSCFNYDGSFNRHFLNELENKIISRIASTDESSYSASLIKSGIKRIAQKVGEEGVEVALAAIADNDAELCGESADLLYHLLVLLQARNLCLNDVISILKMR